MAKSSKQAAAEVEMTAPALAQTLQPIATATTVVSTTPTQLTEEQDKQVRQMKTKSEQMRFLAMLGWKNGPIAKYLSIVHGKPVIYQHVRNVLKQPLKKETQTPQVS
jgi:hypothetical protein